MGPPISRMMKRKRTDCTCSITAGLTSRHLKLGGVVSIFTVTLFSGSAFWALSTE